MTDAAALSRLLRPRSIAVVGGRIAAEVIRQCRRMGYDGQIWPVHPSKDTLEGLPAVRSIEDLPQAPDVAFVGVNRHLTVDIVAALARRRAGGAVCYASGFAESGPQGLELQSALLRAAQGMPFFGPNCYGLLNYLDRVALWPDQHGGAPRERGVALITQSGNIGLNLTMQRRALPIAYLVTLGNQASIGLAPMIDALIADQRVSAIGLHIEGVDDPVAFARACARAQSRSIPIVALKTGRSAAGAAVTVSHTASLAGTDSVAEAYFRRLGVVRVSSLPVLLESLKVLHLHGPMHSKDIASLSCSGGEAALIADAAEAHGLRFRPFDEQQKSQIEATLTELVTVSNPFDYHTFAWGDLDALTRIFAATMQAGFGKTLLVLDFPRADRCNPADWDISLQAMIAASKATGQSAGIVASLPECLPEDRAQAIFEGGLVPLFGLDEALAALAAAAAAFDCARQSIPTDLLTQPLVPTGSRTLSEWEGKRLLAAHGLTVPAGRLLEPGQDAGDLAARLGLPVVVKAVGAAIAHKTEIGAVRLNLRSAQAVREAVASLAGVGQDVLVEVMVPDAVAELIIGVNRDPVFGLYLVIGAGGQLVELIDDRQVLLLPSSREAVTQAILSLRSAKLLQGYRRQRAGDIEAVVSAVMAVQHFASAHADRLLELDINPLIVRPAGCGAVAADALIRLSD